MQTVLDNLDVYARGWRGTVQLTALSFLFALFIGLVVATARVSPVGPLRVAATFYIELIRSTPLTVHLLILLFGMPKLGFLWSPFVTAVIGLSIYTGAFVAEILRAGINTVGRGQIEAARSIGLPFVGLMRLVVLPQALRSTVAPLGSQLSALVRNSAVAYTISVAEIMRGADELIGVDDLPPVPVLVGAALAYYTLTVPLAFVINAVDRRQQIAR